MEEQTESNKRPLSLDEKKSDLDVDDNKPSQGAAKKQTTLSFAPNSGLKTHFTVPGFLTSYLTEPSWLSEIANDFKSYQFRKLEESVKQQYERTDIKVYPPKELVFNAFNQTPLSKVKVVILGQDPYHAPSQAMGLSFSVSYKQKKTFSCFLNFCVCRFRVIWRFLLRLETFLQKLKMKSKHGKNLGAVT